MPGPKLRFSFKLKMDKKLGPTEISVNGQTVNVATIGDKVRIAGPRDRRICPECVRFVGKVFDADDPSIQAFYESGLHPRCRHYAVPEGLPSFDREIENEGMEYVDRAAKAKDERTLTELFGRRKAQLVLNGLPPLSLYGPDGKVRTLAQLAKAGILTDEEVEEEAWQT